MMFEYFRRSVAFLRVKLTAGRVKSQGSVDGIENVITSLFLKPTACRSLEHGLQEVVISGFSFKYRVKFRIKNGNVCRVVAVTT